MKLQVQFALIGAGLITKALPVLGQNLISNGNFESPLIPAPLPYITYTSGQTLFGWSITKGDVDLVSPKYDGNVLPPLHLTSQVLDLNGSVPGAIQQVVATKPGQLYALSWKFQVGVGASPENYSAQATWDGNKLIDWQRPPGQRGFETLSLIVTGTGRDTIGFQSLGGIDGGFLLDDITLAVPEPSSNLLAFVGALAILAYMRWSR